MLRSTFPATGFLADPVGNQCGLFVEDPEGRAGTRSPTLPFKGRPSQNVGPVFRMVEKDTVE